MLTDIPEEIPGQRDGDRAYTGSNLIHDTALLQAMLALGGDNAKAAERYLERFATHCTDTLTGLFPWGEHAYWDLANDRPGFSHEVSRGYKHDNAIHDHLRQAPLWLWEKLYEYNPRCVERFAEGLNGHWSLPDRKEYIRHAFMLNDRCHGTGKRSCDFPRHSGFYILDLAYAWIKTGREDFRDQIISFFDYWWEKRHESGLLRIESRSPDEDEQFFNQLAPGQTVSLAVSLLETADLIESTDSELARDMRERASIYIDGFLSAPHDLHRGRYFILCHMDSDEPAPNGKGLMPIWGSSYGVWPASYVALTCCQGYRLTGNTSLLDWAMSVGGGYASLPMPDDVKTPAMDAGLGLGLLADLYDITGDSKWLRAAETLALQLIDVYFCRGDLPTGAAGIDWYESQMGPSFLLHGLARTALLAKDRANCPLAADYTAR
jgi:hypothetical protein